MMNYVLYDCVPSEEFLEGLRESTGERWTPIVRHGEMSVARWRRLVNFVTFPLEVALRRRDARRVVGWQQYYGLFYAAFAAMTGMHGVRVTVMTFIFRQKGGLLGRIHRGVVDWILRRRSVEQVIVFTSGEVEKYGRMFPRAADKFRFVRLGIPPAPSVEISDVGYFFASGRSNRDYGTLEEAFRGLDERLEIACPGVASVTDNVTVHEDMFGPRMWEGLSGARGVMIPLSDPTVSSGQLSMLQAWQMGKPVVVTRSDALADYVVEGENALVAEPGDAESWRAAVGRLGDAALREKLAEGGRRTVAELTPRKMGASVFGEKK